MTFTLRNAIPGRPPKPVRVAKEIAPGLYVHRVDNHSFDIDDPVRDYTWAISHHEGVVVQFSRCRHVAVATARLFAKLTDWTVSVDDIQKQVKAGLGSKITQIREAENAKPLCCPHL